MIWLNNCGTTPAGKHIIETLSHFMEGYALKGTITEIASYQKVQNSIKKILCDLLNCSLDELALIHNTHSSLPASGEQIDYRNLTIIVNIGAMPSVFFNGPNPL